MNAMTRFDGFPGFKSWLAMAVLGLLLGMIGIDQMQAGYHCLGFGGRHADADARLEGRFQRVLEAPHRRVVEGGAAEGFDRVRANQGVDADANLAHCTGLLADHT